jgi:hypothetical protein
VRCAWADQYQRNSYRSCADSARQRDREEAEPQAAWPDPAVIVRAWYGSGVLAGEGDLGGAGVLKLARCLVDGVLVFALLLSVTFPGIGESLPEAGQFQFVAGSLSLQCLRPRVGGRPEAFSLGLKLSGEPG